MKNSKYLVLALFITISVYGCRQPEKTEKGFFRMTKEELNDKIKGAWALQTIGVTFGGPTEFRYKKKIIPDSVEIIWNDTLMYHWMTRIPGLYDDIYMDLTFVDVFEKEGLDAPASSFGNAYANAGYMLWHANQQGRYNILNGINPPHSGSWLNNPHADDIDFQIEADFAGIMTPGMPNSAAMVCDKIGHIMNSGDGYYGGVYMAALYSYAFISNDVEEIVSRALMVIPKESMYYQCMIDVINWYKMYPNDWKKTWEEVEKKWGEDIGCPDGAGDDFNIDAKINSAYVIIGLLYGHGDPDRTMDIATRCGQDSDCNSASAAGILGTIIGYKALPPKWTAGLSSVEDMDFKYTSISLNESYELSTKHALAMIARNGGDTTGNEVKIKLQEPVPVPLEVNFPGYKIAEKRSIDKKLSVKAGKKFTADFDGVGIVIRGMPKNVNFANSWALLSEEETMNNFILELNCIVDNQEPVLVRIPLNNQYRNTEILYFKYELPSGKHTVSVEAINLNDEVYLEMWDMIVYSKNN